MWILGQKFEFTAWKIWILSVNFVYLVSCLPAQPIRPSHLAKFGLWGLLNHTYMYVGFKRDLNYFFFNFPSNQLQNGLIFCVLSWGFYRYPWIQNWSMGRGSKNWTHTRTDKPNYNIDYVTWLGQVTLPMGRFSSQMSLSKSL